MFKRNKKRLKNDVIAANIQPPPRSNTIINHGPNLAAVVLTATAAIAAIGYLIWLALIGLMAAAGSRAPEQDAAWFVFGLLCLAIIIPVSWLIGSVVLGRYFKHQQELARITGEWKYKQLMAARQPVGNSRTMGEDARFARLIESIMTDAYFHIEEHGQYTKDESKPWARNQAKEIILTNEREPVGWTMGARVRPWLEEHGILIGDTVDLDRFPGMTEVQQTLRLQYEIPINARRSGTDLS
ncbi:MAG: hypothetical protein C4589_11690 [Peptococcaceae bacterium]|jgi:hypothetical protein|nr:MAG: hypothetical protein C4589_11690 [Peptococcaceae bacterium]